MSVRFEGTFAALKASQTETRPGFGFGRFSWRLSWVVPHELAQISGNMGVSQNGGRVILDSQSDVDGRQGQFISQVRQGAVARAIHREGAPATECGETDYNSCLRVQAKASQSARMPHRPRLTMPHVWHSFGWHMVYEKANGLRFILPFWDTSLQHCMHKSGFFGRDAAFRPFFQP